MAIVSFFPVNQEEEKEKGEEEVEKNEEEVTTTMSLPEQCSRVALNVKAIVSFH